MPRTTAGIGVPGKPSYPDGPVGALADVAGKESERQSEDGCPARHVELGIRPHTPLLARHMAESGPTANAPYRPVADAQADCCVTAGLRDTTVIYRCSDTHGSGRTNGARRNDVQPSNVFMPISRQSEVASVAFCSANASLPIIFCSRDSPFRHCARNGRIPSSSAIINAAR